MPIFFRGEVVGYERFIAPRQLEALQSNTHLGEMIGAWAGRQGEEELAQGFNRLLIDRAKKIWDDGKKDGRKREFVDLSDPDLKDQVHKDAWSLVPAETRDYIKGVFGDDGFMVRRDMVNNTVGYRSASIGEAWVGPSRLSDQQKKLVRAIPTVIMGKDAFRNMVVTEKFWEAGISIAKHTIVVRSIIVPASNIASNVLQLMVNGVNIRDIYKGFTSKLVEIDQHLKNLDRLVEIETLLARHFEDPIRTQKLLTEKKSLEDSSHRMSIAPLVEAGEFATISEGLTEADAAIASGKWVDYMSKLRLERTLGDRTKLTSLYV